jgi:hypothetical protein
VRDWTFLQRRDAVLTDLWKELGTLVSSVGRSNPERNGSTKVHTTTVRRISEHLSSQTFCYCRMPSFDCSPHLDEQEKLTTRGRKHQHCACLIFGTTEWIGSWLLQSPPI